MPLPILRTERLLLRGFAPADAPRVQQLAGARDVATTTLTMPHPYEDGMAELWIDGHAAAWESGKSLTLAITAEADGVIGGINLNVEREHRHAEIGYWIGVPYWHRGFATEAAGAVIDFAFGELGLHRVLGRFFARNPASGRVLSKIGMVREGTLRRHMRRWDRFEDLECYAVLASDWRARGLPANPTGE